MAARPALAAGASVVRAGVGGGGDVSLPGGLLPAFRIALITSHANPMSSAGPISTAQPPVVGALSPPPAIAVRMVVSAWMFR